MPPALERSFPGEMLSAFRAWLGLSQDDVACILGIATRSVQTYEGQGGPEWLRYALLGWAVVVHGEMKYFGAFRVLRIICLAGKWR